VASRRKFSKKEIEEFVRLSVHEERTLREIARVYETTPQAIRYHLLKHGATKRQRFLEVANAKVRRVSCSRGCILTVREDEIVALPPKCPVHHLTWVEATYGKSV